MAAEFTVSPGIRLVLDGREYGGGDTVTLTESQSETLVARGRVVAAERPEPVRPVSSARPAGAK